MSQLPTGTIVNYSGTWQGGLTQNPADVLNAVASDLVNAGIAVRNHGNLPIFSVGNLVGIGFNVTLQLQVENQGYASEDDLIAVIRHWVFQETGNFPTSDTVPTIIPVGGGTAQQTGQPLATTDPSNTPTGCIAGTGNDVSGNFSFTCWFGNLTNQGLSSVGLLATVVIVGIGIAIFAGFRPRA